ncbi:transposase [Klebsiella pneumoniae]|nr:transposase [Klebsiella pneumoniae]
MQHRIILPGATTLTRLISEVREKATLRLWNKLALIPSAEQRSQLEMLLGPTDCSRLSLLESLKKGPVTISGPAFNEAIERWKTLNDFGLHAENLSTLPAVRLKNLARYAGMTSVFNIARMSPQKRMAVLVAFVLAWETLALDDALDVLDAMLAVIIRDARKIGQKKRLRSLKDLDKSALALASACSYLLKEETPDESIRAEVFSYIPRQKLAEIITLVREIARPSDDNFHEEMVEQYGRVRRFLPHLLNTVKFSSAPAGVTTLNACDYLSREFSSRRQFFDDAPTEIISRSWKRLVINKEKHITRRGYTLCFLSKLQDSLRRRDVYVTGSNRWGDPRARLLQGADWQANRIKVYRSLGHPTDPQEAIKSLGHQLDSRYRQVAARLCENEAVELDVSGPKPRLTISPLASLDEPDSLKRLSKMISDLLPPVDLTELLLEINAHTGFADEFFHASEASARVDDLPVSISAVLMAEACNIGLEPLIRSNVPALTRHRLNWTKANYLRAETITSANARLVDFQATLPLAQIWGIMRGEASPFVMELPVYHVPHIKSLIIQTWQRLKGFVLRAGKVIVIVSIFLSALNSFSLSGKVVDNINDSALASVSRVITPVFKPIGVHEDNWQATVGLFTGAMAKEVVVGTLNTLYTAEDIQNEEFNPQTFSLGEELLAAVDETWQGLKDTFSLSVLANPIEASKGDGEMATGAMGVMGSKFGSAAAAYSYLIFVLLYIPCISVMGAIARESSRGWMTFSILWGLNIAYSLSTLYYQTVSFSDHPRYSLVCILAVVLFNVVLFGLLRRARSRVDVSLLATRKTPASCCSSPAGDCH